MAGFCYFWKLSPAEYWSLKVSEQAALFDKMEEINRAKKRAADRQRAAARRARRGR